MQLIEIEVHNFKRFQSHKTRFVPGLNVVWGPNESGKTTIHEAISCALFDRDRTKPVESWFGGPCFVRLVYSVNGKTFAVERQLSEGTCRLGMINGDELTQVVTDKSAVQERIIDHLGLSERSVFDSTVSIPQTEIRALESSTAKSVGQEIQRVLTGTTQGSATRALERLQREQQEIRGRARPKNPREYENIEARLQELARASAEARNSNERIQDIEQEISTLEEKVARQSERLTFLGELVAKHQRWSDLKNKEAQLQEAHSSALNLLRKVKDSLDDLNRTQKDIEKCANLVGKADEVYEHLTKLASRRSELEERLRNLEGASTKIPLRRTRLVLGVLLALSLLFATGSVLLALTTDAHFLALLAPAAVCAFAYVYLRAVTVRSQHEDLDRMADQAREELKQVGIEEESILRYIGCDDIQQGFAKVKWFQSRVAHAHDIEITLNALLAGRKVTDLENDEIRISSDLAVVQRQLSQEFPDYAPTTEESEGWRSEEAMLRKSLAEAENRLHMLRGELEAERRNARDIAGLEGELEYLHRRKQELDFLYKAYDEAIAALRYVINKVSDEYLPTLSAKATKLLNEITAGRYSSVRLDADWNITMDCTEKGNIEPTVVSTGTADQVYFALRAACTDLLSAGRTMPMILDDPFVNFDRDRLTRVLDVLKALSEHNQIILLTHDTYVLEYARTLGAQIHML